MIEHASAFKLEGRQISSEPYGNGHINSTYRIKTDTGNEYILQKINRHVFKDPEALMSNIAAVTGYLHKSATDPRTVLTIVPTKSGLNFHKDDDGEYWRVYHFIKDSLRVEYAESPDDFRESGVAFGKFQQALSEFRTVQLVETIPRFHDTPFRFEQLKEAIEKDVAGRLKNVSREIDFALEREDYAHTLALLQAKGALPLRVAHNDTKLNNVLFDKKTRKALCVIDLDTVMPGLAVTDFGDAIRFGASTAVEDEEDLDKVSLSLELFEAFASGYISNSNLTDNERFYLRDGAKIITLEQAVRFLIDYINGDTYYRTTRPDHNLIRCRTQFKLLFEMEKKWDEMGRILERN